MHIYLRIFIRAVVILFALIGFFLVSGYSAMQFGLTKTEGIEDVQSSQIVDSVDREKKYTRFPLAHTPEWIAFRQAVAKDKVMIDKISKETGISGRLLLTILVPEQMRLFHSNRAIFKRAFEPLKILGSQSQFSWGLFGIKDETARAVELHLKNTKSPFYLGKKFENTLDFKTTDIDQERFQRIIDEHNHYYSYLYTALYISQIEKQWVKAGFPINDKPSIIATLWNLGFEKSIPKKDARSGGAEIEINGISYSFGSLAESFYYSDELVELFP
ncbi:hypothetical protein K9M47_00980 [Candidatus Gracilibacteria bacterium]|nr:hypothetical protein [Candidatus Gracilibacteria bacterium]MCF7898542.1 hypothetical protein [Candidatus Paceibacterota bacterium]